MQSQLSPSLPRILDVDWALSQIGDLDAMREMLVLLQESLTRDLPAIAQALQQAERNEAHRLLHALKGFLPIFCQAALCEQVTQVEGMSKDAQSTELLDAYAALRPQLERLLAEVSAYLVDPDAPV